MESTDLFDKQKDIQILKGSVDAIFFQASDSFYKVIQVSVKESNFDWHEKKITVVGDMPSIQLDSRYKFEGELIFHAKYGQQFKIVSCQIDIPSTKDGLIAYLSGENFPGIGKKTAEKIVNHFGNEAIEILNDNPDKLDEVKLTQKQKDIILNVLKSNYGLGQVIIELNALGFSSGLASKIYSRYIDATMEIVKEDPYRLIYDIDGISFNKVDAAARQMNFEIDSPLRIRGAIFETLNKLTFESGNTYVDLKKLLTETLDLLEYNISEPIDPQKIADELMELAENDKIRPEKNNIYSKRFYLAEYNTAENLYRLIKDKESENYSDKSLNRAISKVEEKLGIEYDEVQQSAIRDAINSPVFLLTGGPGTGKTTIINGIVGVYSFLNDISLDVNQYDSDNPFPIILAAPTGRAAKRMSEATGLPAMTIHRLLGINAHDTENPEETKEINGKLIIIDEMSMVDTLIMETLVKNIPSHMKVIFVGDKNQLPSVGPGKVFSDLLESNMVNKLELQKIYRQGDGSSIIDLAHHVKKGTLPLDFTQQQNDRSFISCGSSQLGSGIKQVVSAAIRRGIKKDDIQILLPMYKGQAGINEVNKIMQDLLNPLTGRKKYIEHKEIVYRVGDRVLHLVNDPENNIFNGDIGKIIGIETEDKKKKIAPKIIVDFDGNEVTFERNDFDNLTLSYCMSIHKSQGSEFKVVIIAMLSQYRRMYARNLLYTALTRAKQKLILLGDIDAYKECAKIISLDRNTGLIRRMSEIFDKPISKDNTENSKSDLDNESEIKEDDVKTGFSKQSTKSNRKETILTLEDIEKRNIDPMIGMEGISPFDYLQE